MEKITNEEAGRIMKKKPYRDLITGINSTVEETRNMPDSGPGGCDTFGDQVGK